MFMFPILRFILLQNPEYATDLREETFHVTATEKDDFPTAAGSLISDMAEHVTHLPRVACTAL